MWDENTRIAYRFTIRGPTVITAHATCLCFACDPPGLRSKAPRTCRLTAHQNAWGRKHQDYSSGVRLSYELITPRRDSVATPMAWRTSKMDSPWLSLRLQVQPSGFFICTSLIQAFFRQIKKPEPLRGPGFSHVASPGLEPESEV